MPERDLFAFNMEDNLTDYDSPPAGRADALNARDFEIYHVRRVVAGNPNTPRQVLTRLAEDPMHTIRQRVAENPRTPPEVLSALARDENAEVRLAVAENPNSPPDILSMLAGDEDVDVRYGVAENPHMPEDILLQLSEDDNPYVRCRALKTVQMLSPEVQSRLTMMMQSGYGESPRYRQGY